jgi:pimeloyl-ACP methyl ester carboxylesterase
VARHDRDEKSSSERGSGQAILLREFSQSSPVDRKSCRHSLHAEILFHNFMQGYSFGALAASVYAPSPDLLNQLQESRPGATLTVRHILISPPVGMTAMFLVPFKFSSYTSATKRIIEADSGEETEIEPKVLLTYGDRDQFSSTSDYQRYFDKIAGSSENDRLTVVVVEGGNHFFSSEEHIRALRDAVDAWI